MDIDSGIIWAIWPDILIINGHWEQTFLGKKLQSKWKENAEWNNNQHIKTWSPLCSQTVTWANAHLFWIESLGKFKRNLNNNTLDFIKDNIFREFRLQNVDRFVLASICPLRCEGKHQQLWIMVMILMLQNMHECQISQICRVFLNDINPENAFDVSKSRNSISYTNDF